MYYTRIIFPFLAQLILLKWNFLFSQFLSLLDEIQQCLGLGSCGSWLGDLELRAGSFSGRWFQILEVEWGSVTGKGKKPIESMLSVRSPLGATGAHSHWDPPGARVEHTWVLPWKGEGAGVCTHQLPSGFGRRPLLAAGVTINSPAHPSCAVHRQTRLWWQGTQALAVSGQAYVHRNGSDMGNTCPMSSLYLYVLKTVTY